jgi:hypothetical protein
MLRLFRGMNDFTSSWTFPTPALSPSINICPYIIFSTCSVPFYVSKSFNVDMHLSNFFLKLLRFENENVFVLSFFFVLSLSLSPSKSLFSMCAPSHTKKIQKRRLENGGGIYPHSKSVVAKERASVLEPRHSE